MIIPVPLHASRKRKRGYNQSAEFGKGLSKSMNKPCQEDVLVRITKTETQTKKTKTETLAKCERSIPRGKARSTT
jgi:predicted amidophosphoribosyltransferase